jgi:hypothetical protein
MADLADSDDKESRELAGAISNIISESSYGTFSEAALREGLAAASRSFEWPPQQFVFAANDCGAPSPIPMSSGNNTHFNVAA